MYIFAPARADCVEENIYDVWGEKITFMTITIVVGAVYFRQLPQVYPVVLPLMLHLKSVSREES